MALHKPHNGKLMATNNSQPQLYPGVMISSTFDDLREHRAKMIEAIEAQGLKAIHMENVPAKPDGNVLSSSLEMVRASSAYILIIGQRYGKIPETSNNPKRLSLTELEYDEAKEIGRPRLIFIMGDEHPLKPEGYEPDTEKRKKLEAFRNKVREDGLVHREFNSPHEFEVQANRSVALLRRYLDDSKTHSSVTEATPKSDPARVTEEAPVCGLIKRKTRRELIEGRFTELLRPILGGLKNLLGVNELALAFLPPRSGTVVPDLSKKDYQSYEQMKRALLQDKNRFRRHELFSAVQIDTNGEIFHYSSERSIPLLGSLQTILKGAPGNWSDWVNKSLSDQVGEWLKRSDKEIVCSLKYIPSADNHDVVGYVVVPRQFRIATKEKADEHTNDQVQKLVEQQLLPVLRHFVLELAEMEVQNTDSRTIILDTILEAAVSLSGADWGCIKSTTLGAASSDLYEEDCELVKAVCVHNCPRFFHEGKLVETEELVGRAVRANEDMVLPLDADTRKTFQHPAAQMAVFLIRDRERVIEPRLDNNVVGAIVVQHSAPSYLEDFKEVYSSFLRELAGLTSRTMRAVASKALVSILKRGKIEVDLPPSFNDKVARVVEWVTSEDEVTWVLLQPDGRFFRILKSSNELDGLQRVLIELTGAEESIHDPYRIAAFVCNSTMSFQVQGFHHTRNIIEVSRVGLNAFGAEAYFDDEFPGVKRLLQEKGENRVVFNLGRREVWQNAEQRLGGEQRKVSLVIGPIVSPTGLPIGVLAVLRQVEYGMASWSSELLKEFEGKLATLRDDLYASHIAIERKTGAKHADSGRP